MPDAAWSVAHAERPPAPFGAILIGGLSRRMGRPKHLVEWNGETWVERIARTLAEVVPEIALVGAGEVPESLRDISRFEDPAGTSGPAGGIVAALDSRPGSAWLVVACDQPGLSGAGLRWLLGERRLEVVAVQPRIAGNRVEPFPGIYEAGSRAVLAGLAGAEGQQASLQRLRTLAAVATPEVPPELVESFRGANRPEEIPALGAGGASHRTPERRS